MSSKTPLSVAVTTTANGRGLELPSYATAHAAGMDLTAAIEQPVILKPGARALVPAGISIALPPGYEAQIRPRSGLALKHGITVLNSPGTIDADYRGEIGVILINHGSEPFTIERGMRIAQMVIAPYTQAQWQAASSLQPRRHRPRQGRVRIDGDRITRRFPQRTIKPPVNNPPTDLQSAHGR